MKTLPSLLFIYLICVLTIADKTRNKEDTISLHEKFRHHSNQERHLYNKDHHYKPNIRKAKNHHFSSFAYRDSNQHCTWVCSEEPGSASNSSQHGFQVIYNGSVSLIGISNNSSTAIIIDYFSNITAIFNGRNGTTFVFDAITLYRLSINSQSENVNWLSSVSIFEDFFRNLSSLQNLLKIAQQQGQKYNFSNITPSVLNEIENELNNLDLTVPPQIILKELVVFATQLRGPLNWVYKGNGSFVVHKNLQWYLTVNLALARLFNNIQVNFDIHLNLSIVFGASSGAEALLNLHTQIGRHVDLAQLFGNILSSPIELLNILAQISGGSNGGVDGLITIIVNIIQVLNGQGSVNSVIVSIINYNPNSEGDSLTLSQIINEAQNLTRSQIRQFNNPALRWFEKFFEALNNNTLVLNNINISDIIKLLNFYRPRDAISTIIKILSQFLPSRGIPQFFNFILNVLNNTRNVSIISELFPGVETSNLANNSESILQSILHGTNLTQLSDNFNISSELSHIPIIGSVINQISSALGDGVDINRYLNPRTVLGTLQNVLSGGLTNGSVGETLANSSSAIQNGIGGIISGLQNTFLGLAGDPKNASGIGSAFQIGSGWANYSSGIRLPFDSRAEKQHHEGKKRFHEKKAKLHTHEQQYKKYQQ